jgi:hypothetical protein
MTVAPSFQQKHQAVHPNTRLIDTLYASIRDDNTSVAASCYAVDAHFEDIAFRLDGRDRIHQMWRMVCSQKVGVTFDSLVASERKGSGHWVARYTFRDTGRRVVNDITSEFIFQDGLIQDHRDRCSAMAWASQAYPFPKSLLVGLIGFLRRHKAQQKLEYFIEHPET